MAREKRGLDSIDLGHELKRPKVPTIASVIVEALKVDSFGKLCSTLEPVFRRVVSEEVERALAKLGPARLGERSSAKRIEGPDGRNLRLHCKSMLSLPIFTGGKVEGEQGAAIHVVLLDANSGHVVTSGPESSAKLDVVVLEGDFNSEDSDDWTEEDFESHVVKEREGKGPLLTGDVHISLKEGVGSLGELTFTDNSSWIRSRKFRLGLKIAAGFCEGTRVREAKTEAFSVKDHRGELYKKHFPPALKDEVWRLKKIGKDGSFHKRLDKAGIYTVEDFLLLVVRDSQRLRKILGSSMSNKMWEVLVEHAKTCVLSGKHYVYYSDITRSIGAIFNNIYEFTGLIAGEQYFSAESLSDSEKVFADTLLKKAYDNRMHVTEYDGNALFNFKKSRKTSNTQSELSSGSMNTLRTYDQHVVPHHMLLPVPCEQSAREAAVVIGGGTVSSTYNGNQVAKHLHQSRTSHGQMQVENVFIVPQNQFISSSKQSRILRNESTGLTLGLLQHERMSYESMDQSIQPGNRTNSYHDGSHQQDHHGDDGFLSEEEIRMRSHDMLVNEDMRHLLGVLSMGGASAMSEDYGFSAYMPSTYPNFNFDEERNRSSSKAFVGWLKIKAAMRWGIFIRKKAAERRARFVELEDL